MGFQGNLVVVSNLTPFWFLCFFYPVLFCWFDFFIYEDYKEIIWKEDRKRRQEAKISFIF